MQWMHVSALCVCVCVCACMHAYVCVRLCMCSVCCTAWNHHYVMTVRVMNTAQVGDRLHVPDRCPLLTCWHTMVPIPNLMRVCQWGRGKGEWGYCIPHYKYNLPSLALLYNVSTLPLQLHVYTYMWITIMSGHSQSIQCCVYIVWCSI